MASYLVFLCGKRQDTALVMVNITLIRIHIAIIAVFSLTYSTPTCAITRIYIRLQYCMLTRAIRCIYYPADISTTGYSRAVQYHTILHGTGVIAQVLLHGPWGYAVSKQLWCALIRIDAFERRVTWYFVWEETRHCSGMDNKHFITLVSMHIAIIALVGCIFTRLRLVKIPCPLVQ